MSKGAASSAAVSLSAAAVAAPLLPLLSLPLPRPHSQQLPHAAVASGQVHQGDIPCGRNVGLSTAAAHGPPSSCGPFTGAMASTAGPQQRLPILPSHPRGFVHSDVLSRPSARPRPRQHFPTVVLRGRHGLGSRRASDAGRVRCAVTCPGQQTLEVGAVARRRLAAHVGTDPH